MERRSAPRYPSWERAVVQWGEDGPLMRALVLDVSQGGARIEVTDRLEGDRVTILLRNGQEKMAFPFTILGSDDRGARQVVRGAFGELDGEQRAFLWRLIVRWRGEFERRQEWLATRVDDPAA